MKTKDEKKEVSSFDELVFENRNKEYGAYEIRRKYNMTLIWAILVGAFCVSASVVTPFFIKPGEVIVVDNPTGPSVVSFDSTIINIPINNPEPPQPVITVKPSTFYKPEVVDSVPLDNPNEMGTAEDLVKNTKDDSLNTNIEIVQTIDPNPPTDDPDKIEYPVNVSEKPMFGTAGDNEFRTWIAQNIHYPQAAIEAQIQGKVYIQFVIEKDGSLSNIKVIRSVDPEIDREAIRVLEQSPKWSPGKQQGRPVRVYYTFPITFAIK